MNSLAIIYQSHHTDTDRHSGRLIAKVRGDFLRKSVGTGKRVLDVGCRNGAITQFFLKGNSVDGLDIDANALKIAASKGIQTRQVDLNGEWNTGQYDVVVMTEVLEHLYFPKPVIDKVKASLVPGGMFIGSVPNAFSLRNRLRYMLGRKRHTPLEDPTHINHFTYSELKDILESRFDQVRIVPLGRYAWLDRFFPGKFAFMLQWIAI